MDGRRIADEGVSRSRPWENRAERQSVDGSCAVLCSAAGRYSSLKLGGGKVHISYYNSSYGNLKYAELAP